MRIADDGIRILRLFGEFHDAIGVVRGEDAELVGALDGYVHDAHGDVRFALFVVGDHRTVIHLVDVIAREDQHVRGIVRSDELHILVHRVCRASIPMRADLLLGGNEFHELAELAAQIAPTTLDVLDERLSFVLGEHGNLTNA